MRANKSYAAYIHEAFGNGSPLVEELEQAALRGVLQPWASHEGPNSRIKLRLLARGGHLKTEHIVRTYWPEIKRFFES